jgi:hypothetical protein
MGGIHIIEKMQQKIGFFKQQQKKKKINKSSCGKNGQKNIFQVAKKNS